MIPLIYVTFLQGVRSRVLYGIFLFAIFIVFLSIIFSNFFMQDIGKIAVDFNLSAISLAGLLISASLSVNLISQDLDKKTIYFVLSRPIGRGQYVWGKYLGLLTIFVFAYCLLTIVSGGVLTYLKSINIGYFDSFNWLAYVQAIYFDFIKIMVFNSIIVLFGVVTTSSFVNLLFSVSVYIAGQSISDVIHFISTSHGQESVTPIIHDIVSVAQYIVPNFEVFDFKVISAHGMLVSVTEFIYITMYGFVYTLIVLSCAAMIFIKKDLL